MRCKALAGLGLLAVAVVTTPLRADDPPKADPAGTGAYMTQLRAWFKATDLDSDGYLDKAELAKVFRGANAKPFDCKEGDDAKDKNASRGQNETGDKPDYSKYPDYIFLTQLDKDKDDKVSKDEFESWARDYAVQLKHLDEQIKKVLAAEQRLARAETKKEMEAVQRELKAEQGALNKMNNGQKSYEKALQQAMKGGGKR
ncbi:MAG TPA: EF-hand domain-containing protein [Gemmataceae bacterium]|jgi:Ca2+-binding EF-hand superfamily protein